MLANRADIYNLGDVLGGHARTLFALSYIENSLTSNPVLAPLATRDPADLHAAGATGARARDVADERARATPTARRRSTRSCGCCSA